MAILLDPDVMVDPARDPKRVLLAQARMPEPAIYQRAVLFDAVALYND